MGMFGRQFGQRPTRATSRNVCIAVIAALTGCSAQPRSAIHVDAAYKAAAEKAQLAANRACIVTALNNTIYKRQGDDQLVSALFDQSLDRCGADFQTAFGTMQQAALHYRATIQEVLAAKGKGHAVIAKDRPYILCGLLPGESCPRSFPTDWDNVDPALRHKARQARAAMEASQIDVIAAAGASDVWGLFATSSGDLKAGIEIIS